MKLLFSADWLRRKLEQNTIEPSGCPACGAIAGCCKDYPNCPGGGPMEIHAPDTATEVRFYGCEFYCLSNFAAFQLLHRGGLRFMTSEHAYHWEKFVRPERSMPIRTERILGSIRTAIMDAPSAHEALMIARRHEEEFRRPDWHDVRLNVMREILVEKVMQHEYVMKKLMQTGDRIIIEDSWRDAFWGIGPNGNGQNQLGTMWMEIRTELRRRPRESLAI